MSEANDSPEESGEASSKAFGISLRTLQLEYKYSIDNFVKATIQVFYDVILFDNVDRKDEVFEDYIAFGKKREKYLELNEQKRFFLLK